MEQNTAFEESFCRLAVERGFCEAPAISTAVREQAERLLKGEAISVAALLVEEGALTQKQAERLRAEVLKDAAAFPEIPGFEITDELARCGLIRIYQGHQKSVDRPVLLKVLAKTSFNDGPGMRQFQREARLLAALNHRHISGAIDMGETPACLYLVLHHFRGRKLSEHLAAEGPLPEDRLIACATALAEALDYIHNKKLAHGNLCARNVIVTDEGNLLLTGFDLLGEDGAYTAATGEVTPAYYHPLFAELPASRVDLFALGCLLFAATTGKSPFDFPHAPYPTRPVACRHARIGSGIAAVIHTLLDLRPGSGYQSAAQLLADLALLESGQQPRKAQKLPGIWGRRIPELPLWPRSRRMTRALYIGGAVAGFAGGVVLTLLMTVGASAPGKIPLQLRGKEHWQQEIVFNQRTDSARVKWQQAERLAGGAAEERKQAVALYQSIVREYPDNVYAKQAVRRLKHLQ